MSVINKMLKDLDDRQDKSGDATADAHSGAQFHTQSHQAAQTTSGVNKVLLGLIVIVLIMLSVLLWKMFTTNDNSVSPMAASPSIGAVQDAERVIDGVVVEAHAEELVPEQVNAEPEPVPQEPLPPEPLPPEPMPESSAPTDTPLQKGAEEIPFENTQTEVVENNAENTELPTSDLPLASESVVKAAPQKESKFVINKTSSNLTPEERIEKLLGKAKESYDRGYITEAIEQLTKILAISDSNVEARNLLAAAWYGRGEGNKSVSIINDGLQRYPLIEEWRVTAAKIFFKENNPQGAFSYLDVNLDNASKEFYTLKGNLARELKQFDKAAAAYTHLTKLEPFVGNWWLGLAIAQDSLGQSQEAINSYRKVLEVGGVSAQSITFSQQRIEVLQG